MDKRLLLFVPSLLVVFCLTSCNNQTEESSTSSSEITTATEETTSSSEETPTSSEEETSIVIEDLEDLDAILTPTEAEESTDNYRSYYQLMPYVFADSNGDGVGDLNGITAKLDYIASLNYEGIWMTPLAQATSYHKYDTEDYYSVDSQFGTIADFDNMVTKMHDLGLNMIFDLVINHTSSSHPWFIAACQDAVNGNLNSTYAKYYNFKEVESGAAAGNGYAFVTGSTTVAYECRFNSGMPDLNLQAVLDEPNGVLATELKNIMYYWLHDHDVDGFRLDAVTSYFTGDIDKNTQFLTWLNTYVKSIKEDAYIVGEGSWGTYTENQTYASSGVDSFFDFSNSSGEGPIAVAVKNGRISSLTNSMVQSAEYAKPGIAANFVGNHDKARMIGIVQGQTRLERTKFGHMLLDLFPGAAFNYYGDEAGVAVTNSSSDPNKRLPMPWGDEYECDDAPGTTDYDDSKAYYYGTVEEQLADPDSVPNYVAKANALRRNYPAIARGEIEQVEISEDSSRGTSVLVQKRTYGDEVIYLLINASSSTAASYDYSSLGDVAPVAELAAEGNSTYRDNLVHIRPYGVVILK